MMSTQMACDAPLMDADAAIAALLAQPQEVRFAESAPPRLRLVAAAGSTTTWTGDATAPPRSGGEGGTVFMQHAPPRIALNTTLRPEAKPLQAPDTRDDETHRTDSPS